MDRVNREIKAYDQHGVFEHSDRVHQRFWHVFQCPNTRYADAMFDELLHDFAAGKQVLEVGCSDGTTGLRIIEQFGAVKLLGVDISANSLAVARQRVIPDVAEFIMHDIHQPIDGAFDLIVGNAVLHHVDYPQVLEQLYATNLRPGGVMMFREPLGSNLLSRLWWWWGRAAHTPDERPFYSSDLSWLARHYEQFQLIGVNYLSFALGIVSSSLFTEPDNWLMRWADRTDRWLARLWPKLQTRFRHGILIIRKPADQSVSAPSTEPDSDAE